MRYLVCLSAILLCSGCLMRSGDRVPDLISRGAAVKPQDGTPPAIKLVFTHEHQMEGDSRRGAPEGTTGRQFRAALDRVQKESRILSRASQNPYFDVQYLLFLDTLVNEHDQVWAFISGSSFFLIPVTMTSDYVVTGTLYEAYSGEKLGVYEASVKHYTAIWLPLAALMPVTLFLQPGAEELYDDTFRDLFAQVELSLEGRPSPRAVPANSLVIEEEPAHIRRTIRPVGRER